MTIVCASVSGGWGEAPTMRVSYLAGALQGYTLKLPVLPHRYMDPSELTAEDFFKRWRQIGNGNMEAQSTFGMARGRDLDLGFMRALVGRLGWKVLEGVDPKAENVVGCAVWQGRGKVGCLCRIEPGVEQKVSFPFSFAFS